MKNTLKILGIIALAALIGFTVVGCKKDAKSSAPVAPVVVADSPAAASFLIEFEAFINESADVMQKMLSGDLTVAAQADALGTKAEEMVKRWEGLSESELSPAQKTKFAELEEKLTRALGL